MTLQDPVEVYVASDIAEAQHVSDLLAESGIEAQIVGEPLGMVSGKIPPLEATPRIWVRAAELEQAQPILDQYRRRRSERTVGKPSASQAEEPFCYHCGQSVSPGRSPCPACGRELDWTDRP